jgi:hypothetical protein
MRTLKPQLALGGLGRRERAVFFEFFEKMPEPRQLDEWSVDKIAPTRSDCGAV